MPAVTLDALAAVLPTMDRRQVQAFARSVLGLRTPEERRAVSPLDQLRAGLWEFMAAVGFVSDAQARAVLDRVGPALRAALPAFEAGGPVLPAVHVTFADQQWVAVPGRDAWYNMEFDEERPALPEPAVLLVTCDVAALFLRQRAWLARLPNGGTDAGPEHHAGGPGGPQRGAPGEAPA